MGNAPIYSAVIILAATVCAGKSALSENKEGATVASSSSQPAEPGGALDDATWIWHKDGGTIVHFRKLMVLPEVSQGSALDAHIFITADNGYELYVNGAFVGTDIGAAQPYWQSIEAYDLGRLIRPGTNVIAVRASDLGGQRGLLAAVVITVPKSRPLRFTTDASWRASAGTDPTGFGQPDFKEDVTWQPAIEIGTNGVAPWGRVRYPGPTSPQQARRAAVQRLTKPGKSFRWPDRVLLVRGSVPETSTPGLQQAIWRINQSRAYLELDVIGPAMPGRALYSLAPGPEARAKLLFDAGAGLVGSPSVSYDGETIYFSHAPAGSSFYHIYSIRADGGTPAKLTAGPFHDFDPEPLPDGRIVFSSTRIGGREEYHGNAARSLFVMNADGSDIEAVTHHIVGDMEPKVTADGNIAFIRQDNFFERAKVETQIHLVRPDGSGGQVLFGGNRPALAYSRAHAAEEDGLWLRHYGFGSVAALPDGRVAAISSHGVVIGRSGETTSTTIQPAVGIIDMSALPDGRLLCTLEGRSGIGVLEPSSGEVTCVYTDAASEFHSAVFLGPRVRPPVVQSRVGPAEVAVDSRRASEPTGFLLGQNVFYTRQTNADVARIKAIRVIKGVPFSARSAKHQYAHLGVEAVELGTVPVAPDGSFFIEVPADRALALQAVDAEGRSVINELSWIYVRPGERRSCVGCHSPRHSAPPMERGILALRAGPVPLLGQGKPHRFRGNNAANGGMLNLQFDRFREAASINLHMLAAGGRAAELQMLTNLLATGSVDEQISAANKLAIFRDRTASPALVKALGGAAPEVRLPAALALATCGTRSAVEPLLNSLDMVDSRDRHSMAAAQAAHIALEHLTGNREAFNAYGAKERRQAASARWRDWLARHDWRQIEDRQLGQLVSPNPVEVLNAIETLGHVGGASARAALRRWLEKDPGTDLRASIAAMRALGHMKDAEAVPLLKRTLSVNSVKRGEPAAGSHEFGWSQRPVQLSAAAAEALGMIGNTDAEAALLEALGGLREFWHYAYDNGDHDWLMGCHSSLLHFRMAQALDALGSRRRSEIIPILLRSIPIDTDRGLLFENDSYENVIGRLVQAAGLDAQVVEACLGILGDGQSQQIGKPLKAAVTQSPPAVSVGPLCAESRAAQILSLVCHSQDDARRIEAVFNRYRAMAPSRTRSWVCFYTARALGKLRSASAVGSLLAALERDATEEDFGLHEPPNVFLNHSMTPCYRAAAAFSIGLIGEPRAAKPLLRAVGDFANAMDVRDAAARALLLLNDPNSRTDLEKLAQTYPEISTRRILLQAVGSPGAAAIQVSRSSHPDTHGTMSHQTPRKGTY